MEEKLLAAMRLREQRELRYVVVEGAGRPHVFRARNNLQVSSGLKRSRSVSLWFGNFVFLDQFITVSWLFINK